jgi:cyclophilin family peptidyl-prolyl cis-trans isomerase
MTLSIKWKMTMFKKVLFGLFGILLSLAFAANAANPTVSMQTNKGNIIIELYPEQAPLSVENFLAYVNDGFYNGTIFHRVINNFMIQGGGYTKEFYQDQNKELATRAPIKNESDNGLSNTVGTVAMARTSDPNSASSQFYISVKDNSYLDGRPGQPGYTVFGKVIEGMDVVMAIAQVPTRKLGPTPDVPEEAVVIEKVSAQQ